MFEVENQTQIFFNTKRKQVLACECGNAIKRKEGTPHSPAGFGDGHGRGVCLANRESPDTVKVAHGHQGPVLDLHAAFDGLRNDGQGR